jgi:cyclopropane-fatty-acyl-phospholipid synthase
MSQRRTEHPGASIEAIQTHYDVGNDFYRLWLDQTMTYSSAMWRDEHDSGALVEAQQRKIEWHLRHSGADRASTTLDIGCGWGAVLRAAARTRAEGAPPLARGVGLTLSDAQADLARSLAARDGISPIEIRIESWADHQPAEPYGAIVSIGAFEHFTKPDDDSPAKIEIYRDFFTRCRDWLAPDARMTLQSIAYGDNATAGSPGLARMHEIFPDSDLPRLPEIMAATQGLFEIERLRNDRVDYARTCEIWATNLRARRAEAIALVGPDQTRRYERYLKMSAWGFWSGNLHLLRFRLRRR